MKYYTLDWCYSKMSDEEIEKRFSEYHGYIDSIYDRLPFTLKLIVKNIGLHDGFFKQMIYHSNDSKLVLIGCFGDRESGYYQLKMEYLLANDNQIGSIKNLTTSEFLEILSDEIELIHDNEYVHKILFSNGLEIALHFSDLKIEFENALPEDYARSMCTFNNI